QQQTTRYEMASALARALAVVDMTKASKQDVEMLKRLVVEFKDELEALGVRVDELDERVAVLEDRLGGWHIHGVLALDVTYRKNDAPTSQTSFTYDDAKLFFERTWGENDEYFFQARLEHGGANVAADRFFVEMPFFFDSRLTVGRFAWAWEGAYRVKSNIGNVETGGWDGAHIMTDWWWDGFGFTKNFALGNFKAVVAHPTRTRLLHGAVNNLYGTNLDGLNAWMLMLGFDMQFTEQLGLDLGGQIFIGDKSEPATGGAQNNDLAFDKLWTVWGGLRFNFNDNVALKGIFYHQKMDMEVADTANNRWASYGYGTFNGKTEDGANHWAIMADIKQEVLKYTSLWLEYGQYDAGFIVRTDTGIFYSPTLATNHALNKTNYWRVALGQQWNDKWSTHIFYYGYKIDDYDGANAAYANGQDWKPAEYGLGVQYKLNDYTTIGLNYMRVKDGKRDNGNLKDDDVVRMRTSISF
ncbi:MAG: hypothetical protein IJT20_01180, partial [Synergistaceae bacterium]|nr:hypothetical protein [Synergistaceae bacterium]